MVGALRLAGAVGDRLLVGRVLLRLARTGTLGVSRVFSVKLR